MHQETLFNQILATSEKARMLSAIVQNDIKRMLDDGMITKEQIAENMILFEEECTVLINEVNKNKEKVFDFLSQFR